MSDNETVETPHPVLPGEVIDVKFKSSRRWTRGEINYPRPYMDWLLRELETSYQHFLHEWKAAQGDDETSEPEIRQTTLSEILDQREWQ